MSLRPRGNGSWPTAAAATARLPVLLSGLVLGLFMALAWPAMPAGAHAVLVSTSPPAGAILSDPPSQVVLTFDEPVGPVDQKISVIGPDGNRISVGQPKAVGNEVRITVRTDVPRGTYLVSYRVISADSHPVGAGFTYSVGAPSANGPPKARDAGRTDPVVAIGVSLANGLGYAGLILVIGPAIVLGMLWPARLSRRNPIRLAYAGLGLTAVATVLQIYLDAPYSVGSSLFGISGTDLTDAVGSRYGQTHLIRLAIIAGSALLLRPYLAGRSSRTDRVPLAILALLGLGTWSYSGHPGASTVPVLTMVADMAHLAGASIWIGGLVMLAAFLLPKANARELRAILPVWSNWAVIAVSVLVLGGTADALVQVGTLSALFATTYGRLLLLKILVLAAVLAVASYSRRLVLAKAVIEQPATTVASRPRSLPGSGTPADPGGPTQPHEPAGGQSVPEPPNPAGLRRLRRAVLIEMLGASLILGLTAALVQTTPAHTARAAGSGVTGEFDQTLTTTLYQLQVTITPTQVGNIEIHLFAYAPQGAPMKILQWTATASLPANNIEPITIPMLAITDSHAIGQLAIPTGGEWRFSFTLRTTQIDEATTTVNVAIG